MKKFDANPDIANAWKRLKSGNFVKSDLKLLQHELAESLIMEGNKKAYDPSHHIVQKIYNWEDSL